MFGAARPIARHLSVIALLLLPGQLVWCQPKAAPPVVDAGPYASLGLAGDEAAKPLASVGDYVITVGEFARTLAELPEFERMRYQSVERRKELLQSMIDVHLLAEEARRQGLDRDPIVVDEIRNVLVTWVRGKLAAELPKPEDIPEGEVRAYYDAHRDLYREPERRRIAHIVTKDEATATRVAELARAASATEWGPLVQRWSEERPTPTQAPEMAGDLGFVTAPDEPRGADPESAAAPRVSREMRAAAFALDQVGAVSAPIRDARGFHVVRLLTRNEARDQSYVDVERSIRVRLLQEKREAKERALLDEVRKSVKVEVDEAAVSRLAAEMAASSSGSMAQPPGAAPHPSSRPTTGAAASH